MALISVKEVYTGRPNDLLIIRNPIRRFSNFYCNICGLRKIGSPFVFLLSRKNNDLRVL